MITVTVTNQYFEILGHAGYAKEGEDIVCSAVSFLAQSIANQLDHYVHNEQSVNKGDMKVSLLTSSNESDTLMRLLRESIRLLEKQYPNHVQLKEKVS